MRNRARRTQNQRNEPDGDRRGCSISMKRTQLRPQARAKLNERTRDRRPMDSRSNGRIGRKDWVKDSDFTKNEDRCVAPRTRRTSPSSASAISETRRTNPGQSDRTRFEPAGHITCVLARTGGTWSATFPALTGHVLLAIRGGGVERAQQLYWLVYGAGNVPQPGRTADLVEMAQLHEEIARDRLGEGDDRGWVHLYAALTAWGDADRLEHARILISSARQWARRFPAMQDDIDQEILEFESWLDRKLVLLETTNAKA